MKQFKFSMQKVLEYKTHLEECEKSELENMRGRRKLLGDDLESVSLKVIKYQRLYDEKSTLGVSMQELMTIRSYMDELARQRLWIEAKIEKAELEIERQLKKIVDISREKCTMDKLREKYYISYEKQAKKEEEALLDEFMQHSRMSEGAKIS